MKADLDHSILDVQGSYQWCRGLIQPPMGPYSNLVVLSKMETMLFGFQDSLKYSYSCSAEEEEKVKQV